MKKNIAVVMLCATLAVAACASPVQMTPTVVPTLTFTAVPTATAVSTDTVVPSTATPEAAVELVPEGKPAAEWQGIPIMPGAIAGEGDEESYVFTVRATAPQVQEYYAAELGKLGWRLLGQGKGAKSSLILMFTNGASEMLSITILVKGDECLVLLVK